MAMYGTFYNLGSDSEGDEELLSSFESDSESEDISTEDFSSLQNSAVSFYGVPDIETSFESSEGEDSSEMEILKRPTRPETQTGAYQTISLDQDDDSSNEIQGYAVQENSPKKGTENEISGYGVAEDSDENEIGGYGANEDSEENEMGGYGVDNEKSEELNEISGYGVTEDNEIGGYGANEDSEENEIGGYGDTNEEENDIGGYGANEDSEENEIGGYGNTNEEENDIGGYGVNEDSEENEIGGYGNTNEEENEIGGYGNATTEENEMGGYGVDDSPPACKTVRKRNPNLKKTMQNQGCYRKKTTKTQSLVSSKKPSVSKKPGPKVNTPLQSPQTKTREMRQLSMSKSSDTAPENEVLANAGCYWNAEFQRALDMAEGRAQWTKLAKLAHDFVYCSKTYGKIIITEYYLPEEEKTIKSIDAGGVAGGSKYICSNIFFKFALDTDLTAETRKKKNLTQEQLPSTWMYGGNQPDDYAAMKGSKNDMTGLMSYYNAKIPGLYFPLMAIIDYRGFRLIAMSILPISRSTIRYGSADAGKTIHKSNKEINTKMQQAAEILNLKGHRTGVGRVMIWGPGDIEAHEGKDNKFYVVDFGRTFPPEAPSEPGSRKIFYCLLRPEFVRLYPKPLSSDAFSCWGKCNSRIHNQEVREATEYLYHKAIPQFAKELIGKKANVNDIRLTEMLHSSGINCRHLGRVRQALNEIGEYEELSQLLMTEMVARLLSGLLKQLLRIEMKRTKVASQEPYKTVVIDFLNAILFIPAFQVVSENQPPVLSDDPRISFRLAPGELSALTKETKLQTFSREEVNVNMGCKTLREVESCAYLRGTYFWTRDIKDWIETKFTMALKDKEKHRRYNLRDSIDIRLLLNRLCSQSGIKLSKPAMEEFKRHPNDFQVLNFDLRKVSARVKHLNVIDEAEGNLLFLEARNYSHREGLWDATNQKFARAVCSNTNNPATFVRWGSILLKQCNHFRTKPGTIQMAEKLLENAEEKFHSALKLNPRMHQAKFELGNTYTFKGAVVQLHKPEDTIALSLWNLEEAMKCYHDAFQSSPSYFHKIFILADEITQQAQNLRNPLSAELRSELYLRAFFMIHCAISVAPVPPDAAAFMQGGALLKEYLVCGGTPSMGNYLYGLAGSYLESAYLRSPSASDGHLVYYHQKSLYQIQRHGAQPNLSTMNRKQDVVLLYEIEKQSRKTEFPVCSITREMDMSAIQQDFPLSFFPVVCEDPSSNYHQVRAVNRLFHLLGCLDWNTSFKAAESNAPPKLSFNKSARTFVLLHSPFHGFTLSSVHILLPSVDNNSDGGMRNIGLPSKICLYGSNCQNRLLFSKDRLAKACMNDSQVQAELKMFPIHTENIPPQSYGKTIDVIISAATKQARYLILDIVPNADQSIREVALCKVSFRGHQYHLNTLPHVINDKPPTQIPVVRVLGRSKRTLSTSREKKKETTNSWSSASIRTSSVSSRLAWNSKNTSPIVSVDPTGQILRTNISQLDNEQQAIVCCQATLAISYDGIPMPSPKKIPLLRNRAAVDLKKKTNPGLDVPVGPFLTIWISDSHDSNEIRTLCQLARDQTSQLDIVKCSSVREAIEWLEQSMEPGENSPNELSVSKSASRLIRGQSLRIVSSLSKAAVKLSIIDALDADKTWKLIPVMLFNAESNPPDTSTYRNDDDRLVFSSNCARATVEFASFQLRPSDLQEIPRSRSGSHRLITEERRSSLPGFGRSKRTIPRSNSPLSLNQTSGDLFYYFEVSIISMAENSALSIGLSPTDHPTEGIRLGTTPFSYAFQNNGTLWCGWADKSCYFPNRSSHTFQQNDIIGCGFDARSQQIFWTKNGLYLGPAERGHTRLIDLERSLFPTVCIIGQCSIRANFGKTNFVFQLSKLADYTNPKLTHSNKKESVAALHPYSCQLLKNPLIRHNMELLVVALLAQFSRTLNLLLRAHICHWQENETSRKTVSLQLLDSPAFIGKIPMKNSSYKSVDFSNTLQRGNELHLCALWSLITPSRKLTLNISNWTSLPGSVFRCMFHPEAIQTLHLDNCEFEKVEDADKAALVIAERLVNLYSISLWSKITEQGIIAVCSVMSLRKIDFTNSVNLSDSVLVTALRNKARDSYEALNFTNCTKLSDVGVSHLVSKASNSIRGLRYLNMNYCDKVTVTGISKILHCCKQLQHIHLATNPSQPGMSDQVVSFIAEEYNQKLQTLVLIRSTEVTPLSMKAVAAQCHNLTHLDLAHCTKLTDESIAWLAESGSNLIKLDLFNTAVTDRTALKFVTNHHHLRYISFSRCNSMTPSGMITCFKHMKEVEFLSLRENTMKDEVLRALYSTPLPNLVLIDISSCSQISNENVKTLQLQLPRVLVNTSHEKSKKYHTE